MEAVVHCAAYTAVDAAEDNIEVCRKVNAYGTENIAKVCRELGLKMMYIRQTMCLTAREQDLGTDDEREPLNVYGQTKYEGEVAVTDNVEKFFIVRIAWVFA